MAKYYRQQGETRKRKTLRIVRPILLLVFLGIVFVIGYFVYDIFRQDAASETSSKLTEVAASTFANNLKVQTTPYFQFQTTEKWRAVANETRDGHYVYHEFKGQVVDQELIIDVNNRLPEVLDNTLISRVLPVTVSSQGALTPAEEGALVHCKKLVKPGTEREQQMVTYKKVTFPCNPDSTSFDAVVGLVGGSNLMQLPRPSGGIATYKITYRNFSAQQTSGDFINIIKTFETR